MSRTVPTWVAKTDDAAIPRTVKARVWARCEGRCRITGKRLGPGDPHDYDHILPLSMGGRHAEDNLQLVSKDGHREKTAAEATWRAKADRVGAKFRGEWPKTKTPLRSRGFASSRPQPHTEE